MRNGSETEALARPTPLGCATDSGVELLAGTKRAFGSRRSQRGERAGRRGDLLQVATEPEAEFGAAEPEPEPEPELETHTL